MTTAEKVTLGVAVAGALGVGALLKAIFDHLLGRQGRRIDLAEKSIRVADAAVSMAESQLARAKEIIEALERELEELKVGTGTGASEWSPAKMSAVLDRVVGANEELRQLQEQVRQSHRSTAIAFWRQVTDREPAYQRLGRPR